MDALLTGLRRLEYRGYDSAGLAVDAVAGNGDRRRTAGAHAKGPPPLVFKEQGKIDALSSLIETSGKEQGLALTAPFEFHAGIAHTRWVRPVSIQASLIWIEKSVANLRQNSAF